MIVPSSVELHSVQAFATSLALGLLIGLERERRASARAGVRTFALTALFGALAAMLGQLAGGGWLPAAGLGLVGIMIISAYYSRPDEADPGTTSVVALLVCYCLGALVWYGQSQLAVMLAIATTVLLYFKTELEGLSQRLSARDLISMLQFAVLSFVILPVLPDTDFGPFEALNARQIWLMVVLVSGVSLAGYAALRLLGSRHGVTVVAVFGGLVSSTATTLVFARHTREDGGLAPTAAVVVLLANLTMVARLGVMVAVLAPALLPHLAMVFLPGFVLGLLVTGFIWRRQRAGGELPVPEVRNPTELPMALGFGAIYATVLLCAAWLGQAVGSKGIYALALISGITDVDAIALSSLRLFSQAKLEPGTVLTAMALAVLASLLFKLGLILTVGGRPLALKVLPGLLAIGLGLAGGLIALAV